MRRQRIRRVSDGGIRSNMQAGRKYPKVSEIHSRTRHNDAGGSTCSIRAKVANKCKSGEQEPSTPEVMHAACDE